MYLLTISRGPSELTSAGRHGKTHLKVQARGLVACVSTAAAVRSEYAVPPIGARFSQRCNTETPGRAHLVITSPPAQTPGTMFIINMVISGLHSYAGLT